MSILKFKKAVTLLELVVVITIIGILATTVIASYDTVRKKSRDTRRKEDLNALKSALVLYYQDYGKYPPVCSPCSNEWLSSGTSDDWIPGLTPTYIGKLPKDPIQAVGDCTTAAYNKYCYVTNATRDSFVIWARLENTNDPNRWNGANAVCTLNPLFSGFVLGLYHYCVQSPAL